jgi:hypothetical protein
VTLGGAGRGAVGGPERAGSGDRLLTTPVVFGIGTETGTGTRVGGARPEKLAKSLGILEAPPGFEPGMEVLQGHPRSFSRGRGDEGSRVKLRGLSAMRESSQCAHRV